MSTQKVIRQQLDHSRILKARLLHDLEFEDYMDGERDHPPLPFDQKHISHYLHKVVSRESVLLEGWPKSRVDKQHILTELPSDHQDYFSLMFSARRAIQKRILFECDEILRRTVDPAGPSLVYRDRILEWRLREEKFWNQFPCSLKIRYEKE